MMFTKIMKSLRMEIRSYYSSICVTMYTIFILLCSEYTKSLTLWERWETYIRGVKILGWDRLRVILWNTFLWFIHKKSGNITDKNNDIAQIILLFLFFLRVFVSESAIIHCEVYENYYSLPLKTFLGKFFIVWIL